MKFKFPECLNSIGYLGYDFTGLEKNVLKFLQEKPMCMTVDLRLEYMKNYKSVIKTKPPKKLNGLFTKEGI